MNDMFKEEEANLEATEETQEEEELENQEESEEEKSEEQAEDESDEDYEARLAEEEKRRKKAESSTQYQKEERKKEKSTYVTREELKELEANITRKTFRRQLESAVEREARNPKEAELMLYHYDNTINPTGDIGTDVRRIKLLANEGRLEQENEELSKSLESKESRSKAVSSGSKLDSEGKEPTLDAETRKLIRMSKMTWNPKKRVFENERGVKYNPETDEVTDPRRT